MKIIAFLVDFSVVDRIIAHLKLTFVADRPPPPSESFCWPLIRRPNIFYNLLKEREGSPDDFRLIGQR